MNTAFTLTNARYAATNIFQSLWLAALWASLFARLLRRPFQLATFPKGLRPVADKARGTVKDIPVAQVMGTLDRENDFDNQFRPLKRHLAERWVNAYLHQRYWSPVILHKVGESYYVEDGHHRISAARALGLAYINAVVHEYVIQPSRACCPRLMKPVTIAR